MMCYLAINEFAPITCTTLGLFGTSTYLTGWTSWRMIRFAGCSKRVLKYLLQTHDHENPKKQFPCNICQNTFTRKVILEKHVETVHEKQKLFKCKFCRLKYSRQSSLWSHIQAKHPRAMDERKQKVRENRSKPWLPVFQTVWPDWVIDWTLGKFLKSLATINLAKSHHILRQFL